MTSRRRHQVAAVATVAATILALAACSSGDDEGDEADATVTFRLWDETVAAGYEESFDAFTEENPEIRVAVEVVPWADYWGRLRDDLASDTMADIFWTDTSNYAFHADEGALIDVTAHLGDDHDEWTRSVEETYTRHGTLWGVPQLLDSIALFYNEEIVTAAGIDPHTLRWDPRGEDDTFVPAAQQLTVDTAGVTAGEPGFDPASVDRFGFNAENDPQAINLNFLGSNGGVYQDENNLFAFSSPEGVEAFQYVVDLINTHHVSPSAEETSRNGNLTRELFVQGRMAFFQSGQYSLPAMADAEFEWGVAPMLAGPEGRVGVVHAVAAVGNAASEDPDATVEVLRWLASAEGQAPLGATGAALPAAVEAQSAFTDYWSEQGVEAQEFIAAAQRRTVPPPVGPLVNAGLTAAAPYFHEMFAGRLDVSTALEQAQAAGNEAMQE